VRELAEVVLSDASQQHRAGPFERTVEHRPRVVAIDLEALVGLGHAFAEGSRPSADQVADWDPSETLLYLQSLPRPLAPGDCAWLDRTLSLSGRGNYEILVEWLTIAAASDFEPAFARLREVLASVGRMKYLRPLYTALGRSPRTRALAREVFATAKPRYHQLSRRVAASVIASYEEPPVPS
jgi:leukotriene-A4 hydrolase